ncbi:hypothetical protein HK101_005779, partial [Irineochytrium annulatum]
QTYQSIYKFATRLNNPPVVNSSPFSPLLPPPFVAICVNGTDLKVNLLYGSDASRPVENQQKYFFNRTFTKEDNVFQVRFYPAYYEPLTNPPPSTLTHIQQMFDRCFFVQTTDKIVNATNMAGPGYYPLSIDFTSPTLTAAEQANLTYYLSFNDPTQDFNFASTIIPRRFDVDKLAVGFRRSQFTPITLDRLSALVTPSKNPLVRSSDSQYTMSFELIDLDTSTSPLSTAPFKIAIFPLIWRVDTRGAQFLCIMPQTFTASAENMCTALDYPKTPDLDPCTLLPLVSCLF